MCGCCGTSHFERDWEERAVMEERRKKAKRLFDCGQHLWQNRRLSNKSYFGTANQRMLR